MNAATTAGHTCGWSVGQGNAAVAMLMIHLRCGTILLEPLEDPDDPSPSTKCCPDLAKHLDISLGVDCHRPPIVVLKPEWSNDAMFGDGNPGSALHRVEWPLQTVLSGCVISEDVVLRVHVTWQLKTCLIWKPGIVKKVWHGVNLVTKPLAHDHSLPQM